MACLVATAILYWAVAFNVLASNGPTVLVLVASDSIILSHPWSAVVIPVSYHTSPALK